jgi:hypothetical protein
MYSTHRTLDGDYIIIRDGEKQPRFTRREAEAIVNLLNRKSEDNSRNRRRLLRGMASAMNVPRKGMTSVVEE